MHLPRTLRRQQQNQETPSEGLCMKTSEGKLQLPQQSENGDLITDVSMIAGSSPIHLGKLVLDSILHRSQLLCHWDWRIGIMRFQALDLL